MADKYRIRDAEGIYFLTMTVVEWIDLFTRPSHKLQVVESLRYCQQEKGLRLFAWCLLPSHLHLIAAMAPGHSLSEFLRDFKKFTSKALIARIEEEPESRREWLLYHFAREADRHQRVRHYKVWQDGNHAEQLLTEPFARQKLDYIHHNPVKDLTVTEPAHYVFSSAGQYAGLPGLLDVEFLL